MKKINSLDEIQEIELAMLDYVADLCEKNNLRYYLAGGTLLGAVRHQGFIPWDNDVDISMPRQDYDKLRSLMEESEGQKQYKLLRVTDDSDYIYPYYKVVDTRTYIVELSRNSHSSGLGIYIDIFPIDGLGDAKSETVKQFKSVYKQCYRITSTAESYKNLSLYKKFTRFCWKSWFRVFGREKNFEIAIDKLRENSFDDSSYIVSTFGIRGEKEIIKQEYFAKSIDVDFEGRKYKAPIGYDQYLKQMYGDYMKLPPENERIPNHDIEVYWKDEY
jgi:lipopolysaccharide cholinephosphotransferase